MKIAGIVVLAALTGWFARGIRFEETPEPAPSAAARVAVEKSEPIAEAPSIVLHTPGEGSLGNRNLFAYRVREERPIVAAGPLIVTPLPSTQPPPQIAEVVATREPAPFPWRYIGTVGSARTRVAAFKKDGDIVTVRPGERIGDFVVRSIGLESVEVDGPDGHQRIPLTAGV